MDLLSNPDEHIQMVEVALCVFGIALNVFVLILIVTRSRKEMGRYKYFLMAFVICDIAYSFMHLVVEPVVAVRGGALLIYGRGLLQGRSAVTNYACIVAQCLTLIACHFIYRALIVTGKISYFSNKTLLVLVGILMVGASFYCLWFLIVFNVFRLRPGQYPEITSFATEFAAEFPGNPDEDLVMIVGRSAESGQMDLETIAGVGAMLLATSLSVIAIVVCWMAIVSTLRQTAKFSAATLKMQKQLFLALIVQFIIPCLFIYGPFSFLIILPFFPHAPFLVPVRLGAVCYSLYPIGDSLALLIFIHDYRSATLHLLRSLFFCIPRRKRIADELYQGNNPPSFTMSNC